MNAPDFETSARVPRDSGRVAQQRTAQRVGIVVHHERSLATDTAVELTKWLLSNGHSALALESDAQRMVGFNGVVVADLDDARLDVVIGIGGDGTMLRTADLVSQSRTPIIGVNAGQLGYLTEVDANAVVSAFEAFASGECEIEERMRLACQIFGEGETTYSALNEVVIEKSEPGHTVRLNANLDGEFFTSYLADGVIVATPTGSTAYSLSARGPIVEPTHSALVITPVAPHQLFDRSLVLRSGATIDLVLAGHRPAHVVVDGRLVDQIKPGHSVSCTKSDLSSRFVRFGPNRFHAVLKRKFALADR